MMLLSLLLTAWPIFVAIIVEFLIVFFAIKGIKYLNKKNTNEHRD